MSDLERWRLVKQFTVYQAALLSHGYDPALLYAVEFERWPDPIRHTTLPTINALKHAVLDSSIPLEEEYTMIHLAMMLIFMCSPAHVLQVV